MGNTQSLDFTPAQNVGGEGKLTDIEMKDSGKPVAVWIDRNHVFYIVKHTVNEDDIYNFDIYHFDNGGLMTLIHSFQTFHPLNDSSSSVTYDGSTVIFTFEIKSVPEKEDVSQQIQFALDFSKSFSSEHDSDNQLKSHPSLLHLDIPITFISEKYWYYWIEVDTRIYELYLVEAHREKHGFNSTFKRGDTIVNRIIVDSSNVPFVMNDKDGNPIIACADEGFVPIPIMLPSDVLTLAQVLNQ